MAPSTGRQKLRLASGLSLWLDGCGLALDALDERRVEEFLRALDPQRRRHGDAATGRQLLAHLRQHGRVPAATAVPHPEGQSEQIQRAYERFLVNERGVCGSTAGGYVSLVGRFLAERFGAEDIELKSLSALDANQFILRHAQDWSHSRGRQAVTALRGFLRRLYQREEIPADLAEAVLPVRNSRSSEPPKSLPAEEVEAILSCCDRSTVVGRRDHAILLLLARLGLRAGEVVALTLEDFDWSEGVVNVPGKGPRRELLPLPQEVGENLAAYLQDGQFVYQYRSCAIAYQCRRNSHPQHRAQSAVGWLASASVVEFPGLDSDLQLVLRRRQRASREWIERARRIVGLVEVDCSRSVQVGQVSVQKPRSGIGFVSAGQVAEDKP